MERLTTRNIAGVAVYKYPFECERCGETIWRLPDYGDGSPTEKLADYEDAEEHGLLLRLPISEDAPVYSIEYCCGKNKSNRSGMCFRGFCENCSDKAYYIRESVAKHCSICEINKSVFFTSEEAEAKLKEMEGRKDE